MVGVNLEWKKVQKNETKKKTSEVINSSIPNFNPIVTWFVCNPWNVPSRVISRHHWNIISKVIIVLINNKLVSLKLNILIIPENIINDPIAPRIGHGL